MATQLKTLNAKDRARPSFRDQLRAVLEEDLKNNVVVISCRGQISRVHYAKILGCAGTTLSFCFDLLNEYENRYNFVYLKPEPSLAKRLRSILDADFEAGDLQGSRGGKISRTHYAGKLGCSPQAFTSFIAIFAEFESKSNIVTNPMRHLPKMRTWLREAYEARVLGIRKGKIDRVAFAKRFGLRGGAFVTLYPEIRALLEEYDARVEREGYLPAHLMEELKRLRHALATGPQLSRDRLTIGATALSVVANVSQGRFYDRHFSEAIANTRDSITAQAKASKIDPYFHGRVFIFSDLVANWGAAFVERTADRFKQVASGRARSTAKQLYRSLHDALGWIAASNNSCCKAIVVEACLRGRITGAGEWEDALFTYRDHLIAGIASGKLTDTNANMKIATLRVCCDALASTRIMPHVSNPLPPVKHARRRSGHLRSVAEAPIKGRNAIDYVAFARRQCGAALAELGLYAGSIDSEPFFASIGQEAIATSDIPDDPAMAIKIVLERRLDALQARATAIVEEAKLKYARGRQLIASSNIDCENFCAAYLDPTFTVYQKKMLVRDLFPGRGATDENIELGLANLLTLIDRDFGGVAPQARHNDPNYMQFFHQRYLDNGGIDVITSMLCPDSSAVAAALTLYLIDSGANVSVGRTLNRDCSEASDQEGYRRITGHKARARGKPIIVDLPETASSVRAIDWLLSAGQRFPEHLDNFGEPGSDEDRLFLMRVSGRVKLMEPDWYSQWFKKFAGSIPRLATLNLTPNMIRPSVLLHASLSNDGRLMTGMAWAQHTLSVTQGYQQKWPTRLLYDQMITRFLVSFESLVMKNVPEAADKLGITTEQFAARLGNLEQTGLGTFCTDGRGRPGAEGPKCSTLDCWNDCPHMLIVAEVEAIASLQLWQAALREAQPEWERDQPERWDEVWLPWLCLTDATEEKMVRGPMIKIWKDAQKRASEISSRPDYRQPRPW